MKKLLTLFLIFLGIKFSYISKSVCWLDVDNIETQSYKYWTVYFQEREILRI